MTRPLGAAVPLIALLLALAGCEPRVEESGAAQKGFASPCEPLVFEETPFTLCTVSPRRHTIGTALAPPGEDVPFGSMAALAESLGARADRVALAITAGLADDDGQPLGYFVENGERRTLLTLRAEAGAFAGQAGGVFFGEATGSWQVREAQAFAAETEERPHFATQSTPLLVIDGEVHPAIPHDSANRSTRSGVGVDVRGRALFVISDEPVSMGKLARLYRDVLNVTDALCLGGAGAQVWDPAAGRMDEGPAFGPLIVVENRAEAAS